MNQTFSHNVVVFQCSEIKKAISKCNFLGLSDKTKQKSVSCRKSTGCAIASNKWFDFENVSVTHCCWIIYTSHGKGWDKSKTKHSARWQTYEFNSLEHKKISQKSFSWYFLPKKNNVHVDASNYTALEKTQCF